MKIETIVVRAGRTFNHPHESYSNFRPELEMRATVTDGEEVEGCVRSLQDHAERLMEEHKQKILHDIEQMEKVSRASRTIASLERQVRDATEELDRARSVLNGAGMLPKGEPAEPEIPFTVGRDEDEDDPDRPF